MGVFNPSLESQVAFEAPVQAPREYNALTDIAKLATGFTKASPRTTQTSADRAVAANFGTEIERARDLKEQGKNSWRVPLENAAIAAVRTGVPINEDLKNLYENVSGRSFDSIGGGDDYMEDTARLTILASDEAQALYMGVKAANPTFGIEEVEDEVVARVGENAFLKAAIDRQKLNLELGKPVESTPIVESIKNDFQLLNLKVKEYQTDNIVTRDEFLSASTSVKSLLASKYAGFEANPQVKAVIDQMNGLLDDIGKGVSTDPLDVQLDAIQVALTRGGFDATTIAVTRSMIKTNPTAFKETLLEQFETAEDKTWVDALVNMWDTPTGSNIEDIFDTGRPEVKDKIEVMPIPSVSMAEPEEVAAVVGNMSKIVSTANPMSLRSGEEARNQWLNATNTLATIVANTGDDVHLGAKLLEMFASKGMRDNLATVYRHDPANAAQTNVLLQKALATQKNKATFQIEQTLAAGDGQYLFMRNGKLVMDLSPLQERVDQGLVPQGERRIAELRRVEQGIEEAGGLQQFFKLSEERKEEILQGSTFERIFNVKLGDTFRLVENLESIKTKTQALVKLEKNNASAHDDLDTSILSDEAVRAANEADTSTELGAAPKVEYTEDNPYVFKEGISEEDAEAIYNNLPIGSFYRDPDGSGVYERLEN
tara:strand:- start:721 stop:2688 length:1968 start_codon:yes stop_codon:yes gene_type:complete